MIVETGYFTGIMIICFLYDEKQYFSLIKENFLYNSLGWKFLFQVFI